MLVPPASCTELVFMVIMLLAVLRSFSPSCQLKAAPTWSKVMLSSTPHVSLNLRKRSTKSGLEGPIQRRPRAEPRQEIQSTVVAQLSLNSASICSWKAKSGVVLSLGLIQNLPHRWLSCSMPAATSRRAPAEPTSTRCRATRPLLFQALVNI